MISIFEVFAINRNEQDFLENLDLFAKAILGNEDGDDNEDDNNEEDETNFKD